MHTGEHITTQPAEFVKEPDIPGKAYCVWRMDLLDYASRGQKAIEKHASCKKHVNQVRTR